MRGPTPHAPPRRRPRSWLNRNVLAFGMASFFSDTAYESATAILPMFISSLGGSAAALGAIEGISDALSTVAKLLSGWYSDGLRRRKPLGVAGYTATGLGTAIFAVARTPLHVLWIRAGSWVGRGLRGPARDAMLAESVPPQAYGRAFGFHRAMDTAGAVVGPLLALALTARLGYRPIFALTLVPGVLSIAAFASVRERSVARERLPIRTSLGELPSSFRRFLAAVGLFGLGDFARSLLVLRAVEGAAPGGPVSPAQVAIALYGAHNVAYALSAYGLGALGSRIGARRVLAAGYGLFAATCVGFLLLPAGASPGALLALFVPAGVALAAEEVLEGAAAAELLPEQLRGTGYGVLAAVNGIGDLLASMVVGALWSAVSPAAGFAYAALLAAAGTVALVKTT